jgi:hypothetical protein
MTCNIDNTDRINRGIIGAVLVISAVFNFSQLFYLIVGLVMMVQAMIGWCSIPFVLDSFKSKKRKK